MDVLHIFLRNVKVSQIAKILNAITSITGDCKNTITYIERNVLIKTTGGDAGQNGSIIISVENVYDLFRLAIF